MPRKNEYSRSSVEVDIKLENKVYQTNLLQKKPFKYRLTLDRTDLIIQRSFLSKNLEDELKERENEVNEFRIRSQNAVFSPLLTQALVKKTEDILESKLGMPIDVSNPSRRFRKAVKVVLVLCVMSKLWKRYDKHALRKAQDLEKNKKPFSEYMYISIHSKLNYDVRGSLLTPAYRRTVEDEKRILVALNKYNVTRIFPKEKELDLPKFAAYAYYEAGRVLCLQGRAAHQLYFLLSGVLTKTKLIKFADGIAKRLSGELHSGSHTDITETMQGRERESTLMCRTDVEVVIFERDDIVSIFNDTYSISVSKTLLRSMYLFSSYAIDQLFANGAVISQYYVKDEVIENQVTVSDYLYIIKSGCFRVALKRASRYTGHGSKLADSVSKNLALLRLGKGDIYGLDSVINLAVNKIKSVVDDEQFHSVSSRPQTERESMLVSEGGECLQVNKNAFLKYADFLTIAKLISTPVANIGKNEIQFQARVRWRKYREKALSSLYAN